NAPDDEHGAGTTDTLMARRVHKHGPESSGRDQHVQHGGREPFDPQPIVERGRTQREAPERSGPLVCARSDADLSVETEPDAATAAICGVNLGARWGTCPVDHGLTPGPRS